VSTASESNATCAANSIARATATGCRASSRTIRRFVKHRTILPVPPDCSTPQAGGDAAPTANAAAGR